MIFHLKILFQVLSSCVALVYIISHNYHFINIDNKNCNLFFFFFQKQGMILVTLLISKSKYSLGESTNNWFNLYNNFFNLHTFLLCVFGSHILLVVPYKLLQTISRVRRHFSCQFVVRTNQGLHLEITILEIC